MPENSAGEATRPASARRRHILDVATRLFARNGYRETSIRDIGAAAGILGGSLYHHIQSKEALFVEVHSIALAEARVKVAEAVAREHTPRDRLRAACVAFAEIRLAPDALALMDDLRQSPESVRRQLIGPRDAFENLFRDLVAALTLPEGVDPGVFRIVLLSAINGTGDWYRAGGLTPAQIGEQIWRMMVPPA